MVRRRHISPANSMTKLRKPTCKPIYSRKKINKLFAGLGSVRIVKDCDLGLEMVPEVVGRGQYSASIFKVQMLAINAQSMRKIEKHCMKLFER